ncbi:Protein OS-9 [Orbilia oligospora]|uniref:Endoplasmic reticulum lectin n=2 Tax=Orbilia oligospora TaxID=2813651 RepID=A0A8H8V1L6_ORBOL|nr:Protein OS-9 [Orbilia oligospora]
MVRLSSMASATALLTLALQLRTIGAMFSVHEDLLAYPQYEVRFPSSQDSYVTEEEADRKMASMSLRDLQQVSTSSTPPSTNPTDSPGTNGDEGSGSLAVQNTDQKGDAGNGAFSHRASDDVIYEAMMMGKRRYLCSIPVVQPPPKLNATERRKNKSEEDKELARATVSGTELLRGMEGSCLYFISGWWSYSFCYNDHIKQFHQLPPANGVPALPPVEDPHAASYILGRAAVPDRDAKPDMPKEGGVMEMAANGELKYLVQKLAGGTLCDITGKERRIELQYHCSPHASQDRIGFIKEVTTCCYLMVIYTPRLCSDAAFQPPAESRANQIECLEVMNEERIKEYRAEKERREKNLQALLEIVGTEAEQELAGKLPTGSGKKPYASKPNYKIRNKGNERGVKGGDNPDGTYIITGNDGREQMVMVQELEVDANMLKNLPEGMEIVDIEAFARMARQGQGQGQGQQAGAGRPVEIDANMMKKIQEEGRKHQHQREIKPGKKGEEGGNEKKKDGEKEKKKQAGEGHDEL